MRKSASRCVAAWSCPVYYRLEKQRVLVDRVVCCQVVDDSDTAAIDTFVSSFSSLPLDTMTPAAAFAQVSQLVHQVQALVDVA